jgi:ssDNA-binding Zn-finger/Zn-ribbon topoisomerase 1
MHKDVHTKSPGECPKCGMELELEQPAKAKSE